MYHYSIEIRDKNGKHYLKNNGNKVINAFNFTDTESDINLINLICIGTAESYKAICKKGSQIIITVSYKNTISNTYSALYEYYANEKKFIELLG